MICLQFLGFITLGSLICCFLPAIASYLGGGITVSPLGMAASAVQVGRLAQTVKAKPISARV